MNIIKNNYKNTSFFLIICFICFIYKTDTYGRHQPDININSSVVQTNMVSISDRTSPCINFLLIIKAVKDNNLFALIGQKNHIQNEKSLFFYLKESLYLFQQSGKYLLNRACKVEKSSQVSFFSFRSPTHTGSILLRGAIPGSGWWYIIPAVILAGVLGYLAGRKKSFGKTPSLLQPDVATPETNRNQNGLSEKELPNSPEKPYLQKFEMVTVLFADIEGFSEITDSMEPEVLLEELNSFFFYFDTIVDRYHIEKIKTMGDAYMCAGGIPEKNHTNPVEIVLVALEVQHHLNILRRKNPNVWSVRIGVHTGKVMAGMLGHKKLSYDIWGHTVNVAARLESSCKAGEISISGVTYELVKDFFTCEFQGKLQDKSNGEIFYYVKSLKPEFIDPKSNGFLHTNHHFSVQMQLLRLNDLEEYIKEEMNGGRPDLYFHNFRHTRDVYDQAELLAHSEGVTDEEKLLIKTAALFHDIGYVYAPHHTIEASEKAARERLPLFQYEPQQIETVCRLMKASHYDYVPKNVPEQIIHDANLMYYGRADYITNTKNLFYELRATSSEHISEQDWFRIQIERLSRHCFYTATAKQFISISKDKLIAGTENLSKELKMEN